ncbi:MAG: acyl-CoA thioesterase [Alphaproteobacteria bacterium]|nr:MAG: acyl-CoA thioesterase [Alphaproteobacteria bacterium]
MKVFQTEIRVRFAHTDPAGILFYPRYFEMVNQVMEDWFAEALGYDFRTMTMVDRMGIPAVHVEADFRSPSELGDRIVFSLVVEELGRSSCRVRIVGAAGGIERLTARLTVAFASMEKRQARSWPADLKPRMEAFLERKEGAAQAAGP